MDTQKIVYSDEEDTKPKRTRKPLTDEQKQVLRERLSKARDAKKAKKEQLKAPPPTPEPETEPTPPPTPEPETEPDIKEPLTKPTLTKATKKVKVEDPVEPKPKRKYTRKPKTILTQAFNPF